MSTHARASGWANAALIVNQAVDRSQDPRAAVDEAFCRLRALESQAFALAEGAAYACPAQPCTAFLQSQASSALRASSYRLGLVPGRLDRLLPADTVAALAAALQFFDRQIPGFISQGQLIGVETRVSSPLRFLRDPQTHSSSLPGLYLAGEGAGYAGGIISAGLDGLRLAEAILTQCTAKRS